MYSTGCNVHHQCCYKHSTSCNVLSRHKMKVHIKSFQFPDPIGLGEQQRGLTQYCCPHRLSSKTYCVELDMNAQHVQSILDSLVSLVFPIGNNKMDTGSHCDIVPTLKLLSGKQFFPCTCCTLLEEV